MCPSEVGHNWRYGDGASFHDAGKGLIVKCISEAGKLRTKYKAAFPFQCRPLRLYVSAVSAPQDYVHWISDLSSKEPQ